MWTPRRLQGKPRRSILLKAFVGFCLLILACFGTGAGFVYSVAAQFSKNLPSVDKLRHYEPSQTTRIYSSDGQLIATLFKQNRIWVPIEKIPAVMQQAIVAIEDARFYDHQGVDYVGVVRSVVANVTGGRTEQGASTITMQLARAVFLTPEQTLERKIREMLLAMQIERQHTKKEILELYLNQVYLGGGAYGVEAAAETYFGKRVQKLTLPEAATIAGLPQAPTVYSPLVNPRRAKERQFQVLHRMAELGFVTDRQARAAVRTPLVLAPPRKEVALLKYPYFTSYVIHELSQRYPADLLYKGGLRIYTTLDTHLQALAETAVRDGVARNLAAGYNAHESALVSLSVGNGFIRAMVGGTRWDAKNQFNRAWQALRQPGSSFKIYVYSTALEYGYTPDSIIPDAPVAWRISDTEVYAPHNSDQRWDGNLSMLKCFQVSRDIPAIRMANQVGLDNVIQMASRMGISEKMMPILPLALGAVDVSPLEMAGGVSVVANMGLRIQPTAVKVIKDPDGNIIEDNRMPYKEQVLSEITARNVTTMMEKVIEAGTGTTAQIGRPAAGKTGTTDSHRDAWFVGFTPELVTVVWCGNDDYTPTGGGFGATLAAPTWAEFMKAALAGRPAHQLGLVKNGEIGIVMCSDTHQRAAATCPHTHLEYFKPEQVPLSWCKAHAINSVGSGYAFVNYGRFAATSDRRFKTVAMAPRNHPRDEGRSTTAVLMPARQIPSQRLFPSPAAPPPVAPPPPPPPPPAISSETPRPPTYVVVPPPPPRPAPAARPPVIRADSGSGTTWPAPPTSRPSTMDQIYNGY